MDTYYIEYYINNDLRIELVKSENADRARATFLQNIISKYGMTYLNGVGFRINRIL